MESTPYSDDFAEEKHCIPHEFICPLTLEIMIHPLMDRHGRSYERSAIIEWLTTQNSTCPMTRQPLFLKNLYPNNKLRKEITQWRAELGDDVTLDLSLDEDMIVEQEFVRAVMLLSESYCIEIPTTNQRRLASHHHHHHHHHRRRMDTLTSRMKRLFRREQRV